MTNEELQDYMTFGACVCGRPRRSELSLTVEDGTVVWHMDLVCWAGHVSP